MAVNTPKTYRNMILYSIYVRNYSAEGTFEAVRRDLKRIKDLGTDLIWFMPIHPIGIQGHKGTLGCPYAIRDYRAVNPEYGTLDDFRALVDDIHALGMKCIIDVVYNHTSPDSVLFQTHPEWFYRKPDGSLGSHVGDWSDVIDLDYSHKELWDYQIETLKQWAAIVDGFRCDVAPMVPLAFWLRARQEVEAVRPGCFWLAESVEPIFIRLTRAQGLPSLSDSELYQAFDVCYDYDIFDVYTDYLTGRAPLSAWAEAVNRQESVYPDNYVKLRNLENHDRLRAAAVIPDGKALWNWTAFLYFQKGLTLLYNGQERRDPHLPSLFDKDPVDWSGPDLTPALRRLAELKKNPILTDSAYEVTALPRDLLLGVHKHGKEQLIGVFSFRGEPSLVRVDAPDGVYDDLAGGGKVEVKMGMVSISGDPVIFQTPAL